MSISPIPWTLLSTAGAANPFTLTNIDVVTPWILACSSWRNITHLQIEAQGVWREVDDPIGDCGPDGIQAVPKEQIMVEKCQPGALIGKLGGSSAALGPASGTKSTPEPILAECTAFAIGSFCIVALPKDCLGPLYVSFNGLTRPVHVDSLSVTVKGAPSGV